MESPVFVRTRTAISTGFALIFAVGASGVGDAPTDPGGDNRPELTSISPASGEVGDRATTVYVSLTGAGFDAENLEVNVNGRGVEVANVYVGSETYLTADFILPGGIPTGDRTVTVSTEAGTSEEGVTFSIGRDRPGPDTHNVRYYDNYPAPKLLTVEAGSTVVWENGGYNDHTVSTYGTPYEWKNALLEPGEKFSHTFTEPGEYGFICAFHQVVGNVTVVESGTMTDDDDSYMDDGSTMDR